MKLVTRLTIAFLLVVIVSISLVEWRRLVDEVADFEADMDRTHLLVGTALADAAEVVTERDGFEEAVRVVDAADRHQPELRIRWVCHDGAANLDTPLLPCDALSTIGAAKTFTAAPELGGRRASVVPVHIGGVLHGAIEVSEAPDVAQSWGRKRFEAVVQLAIVTVLGMTAFAFILGWWVVARPTRALVQKARDVGRGQLKPDLTLPTGDEFELLATEMNAMCGHLEEARETTARAQQAREAALEHLRHADRLATVGRLSSGLAHELGTPLNVIEARASLIADDVQTDDRTRASARVIIGQSEQVTKLVKQLLLFSRPRKAERERTSLDQLARMVADLLQPIAAKKPVTLDVSDLQPVAAMGDPVLLQQALTNLVVNAMHACGPNGHVFLKTGAVETTRPGESAPRRFVTLAVVDDGVGVSDELRQSIFEPFFSTRPVGEGTGLGLPIVTSIVDEHGGFVTLDSKRGLGSTFTIHLPEATA